MLPEETILMEIHFSIKILLFEKSHGKDSAVKFSLYDPSFLDAHQPFLVLDKYVKCGKL